MSGNSTSGFWISASAAGAAMKAPESEQSKNT
jgi:hypothetical protein